jgi:hypothetical protein
MTNHNQNFFSNIGHYFDQAAAFTNYPKGLLKLCNSVYQFEFPLRHPDGSIVVIHA